MCQSLSEPHIINAFKSDYVAVATAAEARVSFELQPTIRWLSSSLLSIRGPCVLFHISKTVYGRKFVRFSTENEKNENENSTFGGKRKWPKLSKTVGFSPENENEFRSVSNHFL